ncbi:MAG: TIGR04086 family membrane protein [Oscillospiraceae bacterium]|nr:TIGR04086 family membrane protein [Oscillospiraceae bacterium]
MYQMNMRGLFVMTIKKTAGKNKSAERKGDRQILKIFAFCQIFALIVYLLLFMGAAYISIAADLGRKYDFILSCGALCLAAFATAYFSGRKLKEKGLIVGLLFTLPMNVLFLLISLLINNFSVSLHLPIITAALLAAGALGGISAVNKKQKRRR